MSMQNYLIDFIVSWSFWRYNGCNSSSCSEQCGTLQSCDSIIGGFSQWKYSKSCWTSKCPQLQVYFHLIKIMSSFFFLRPNIVVRTLDSKPFQEDKWQLVRISDAVLEFSLPDNRCLTVNYNQKTSKK